jgi:MFS family permease
MLQNGLTGVVIFGWASIDKTMLATSEENGGAGLTFHETTLIFSWATCVAMVTPLILGILLDTYGPRVCSIVSSFIVVVGCQIFASSHSFSGLATSGACLIAFGGPGITSSIIHIANVFPGNEYLVMSCLSGSIAMSFSVFAAFDVLWNRFDFITFRTMFSSYSWVIMVLAVGAFFMYPDEPFEEFEDDLLESNELLMTKSSTTPPSPTTILYNPLEQENTFSGESAPCEEFHHDAHIQSVAQGPSLKVEQSLNLYLRDSSKIIHKTESFFVSQRELRIGNDADAVIISLKDQPFYNQIFNASFFRSSIVFLVTSFIANFYVASISTEVSL